MPDDQSVLGGTLQDVAGLSFRAQLDWAKLQLFYMPGNWRNVLSRGFKWRGFVLGGTAHNILNKTIIPESWGIQAKLDPVLSPLLRGGDVGVGRFAMRGFERASLGTFSKMLQVDRRRFGPISARTQAIPLAPARAFSRGAAASAISQIESLSFSEQIQGALRFGRGREIGERVAMEAFRAGTAEARGLGAASLMTSRFPGPTGARVAQMAGAGRLGMGVAAAGTAMSALNVALLVSAVTSITAGAAFWTARAAVGLANRLSIPNYLDFGDGVYAASLTQASTTERQRALQEIQRNNLNARMAIGNEAALMHS